MILYSKWVGTPLATRNTLAQALGIAKTGTVEVQDNRVVKDGYALVDVENGLVAEKLQAYAGSTETDLPTLFELAIAKAEGREAPMVINVASMEPMPEEPKVDAATIVEPAPAPEPVVETASEAIVEPAPKRKGGRPKKTKADDNGQKE